MRNEAPSRRSSVRVAGVLAVAVVAAVSGCAELDTLGTTRTSSATDTVRVPRDDAALRIRNARCAREVACDNVGEGHRFPKIDACLEEYEATSTKMIASCRGGFVASRLDECDAALRGRTCGAPLDDLDTMTACRLADMCIRP